MNLRVRYTDSAGVTATRTYTISYVQFIKHFVLAGAAFSPRLDLLRRGLGAVAWYWDFLRPIARGADRFGQPSLLLRDPTLKAHFSNLAGRSFADYLCRAIEGAVITFTYEGAMLAFGLPVVGPRPDLYAIGPGRVVALEAKGYTKGSVTSREMVTHKLQAQQGPLLRHSWAASVGYNFYKGATVWYMDPDDQRPKPNAAYIQTLVQAYREDAATFIAGTEDRTDVDGRVFARLRLVDALRGRYPLHDDAAGELEQLSLLVAEDVATTPLNIGALTSRTDDAEGRRNLQVDGPDFFVDRDGIGISLTRR